MIDIIEEDKFFKPDSEKNQEAGDVGKLCYEDLCRG